MNIMMVGVGGQGLVMTSGIIAEVARRAGFDVKTNDVIGLSQRGGRVWASIRFDKKVYSTNIPDGEADFLLALEPLEGYRYKTMLKDSGIILMNERIMYPADVVFEKADYPNADIQNMLDTYESYSMDATKVGKTLGNKQVANTIILGMLAKKLEIDRQIWEDVIHERVPQKAQLINQEAFEYGYDFV
jgi:indolepyruvate ferredoxin oxidoreductase beta subunit